MNLQEIKYDAFISYRHCESDQFAAETLHKELEAFRLPRVIAKQLRERGVTRKKIERVFRDRDELPITNNLADPITNALRNSDFLLVICSPRLKESLWCRKEIETFISMHGRERVFAVLIEGEPEDSFPEELLYEEKKVLDTNGIEQVERVPIEPLAADVRGRNKSEIRKKIKEEVLRLAAPMFDCSYDDLKQRHRERAIRRILATAGVISAVFGIFGIVSAVMAYQIRQQSIQIQEQSGQIKEQSDQISRQYQEALRTNAKQLAEDAFALIKRGDMDEAVRTAYYALTGKPALESENGQEKAAEGDYPEIADMPYTSEAEYALSSALQVYRNGSQIAPTRLLKQDSQIGFCHTSPDLTKLMVVDIFGNLTVFDPLTGNEVYHIFLDNIYMAEEAACFVNNHVIAYPVETGFALYDMDTQEERRVEGEGVYLIQTDKTGKYLCAMNYSNAVIYDTATLQPVYALEKEDNTSFSNLAEFSRESGEIAALKYLQEDKAGVYLINIADDSVSSFLTEHEGITSMWVEDEYVYLTAYSGIDPIDGAVYCLKTDGSLVWKYVFTGIPDHILAFGADTADKLAFENYSRLCVINKEDGSFLCETDCGREIVTYAAYENSDTLTYMSREGEYHYYMTDSNEDMVIMDKFITNSDNLKDFDYGNGYYTSAAYSDNAVAVYENIMGKEAALQVDIDKTPLEMEFSKDEKYLVCSISETDYRTLLVVDMEKKEVAREIVTDSLIRDFAVTQKDEIMVLHTDSIESYDLINGERIFKRETPTSNRYFLRNGEAYAGEQLLAFHMCDTRTGDALYIMEDRHILQDGMLVSDIDSSGEWYAYAGEEEKGLVLGTFENGNIRTIDVNINAVNDIALAKQEQVIYVTYLDETVEVYNSNTGEFLRSYDNLSGGIKEVIELPEMELTLLLTTTDAYLLNEDKEVIAFIEGFECYKSTTDSFILSNYGRLYEVSRYGLEELIGAVH